MVQKLIYYFASINGVTVITPDNQLKTNGSKIIKYLKSNEESIIAKLKKSTYNVVNCHTFYLADFAIKVAKELDLPLIFTLHGVFIQFYDIDYKILLKKIYKKSNSVVTVSKNHFDTLNDLFGDKSKLKYITNGVEVELDNTDVPSTTKIIEKTLKEDSKYLVVVPARLSPIKGLDYLIESTKYLDDHIKIMICSPIGRNSIAENIYKKKLTDRLLYLNKKQLVDFLEFNNSQLISILNESNLVLLPSLIEGVSIALLESMTLGCIVAASKVGGNCEIINHMSNGFLFNSEDEFAISNIINEIRWSDKTYLDKIRLNAKNKIRSTYPIDKMLKEYHLHFENIFTQYRI